MTPQALYGIKFLALPQVLIYQGRADYKLQTGKDAPAPDYQSRDPKFWVDLDALRNPQKYTRRITYDHALAVNADGTLKLVDASADPSPGRRAFYAAHNILQVPTLEPLELTYGEATTVNLDWDAAHTGGFPAGAVDVPFPVRALAPNEAFFPSPFANTTDNVEIANMDLFAPPAPAPGDVTTRLDTIAAMLGGHGAILSEIDATLAKVAAAVVKP